MQQPCRACGSQRQPVFRFHLQIKICRCPAAAADATTATLCFHSCAVIPSLNIAAGLLGFFFLGGVSRVLARLPCGWGGQPMTAQVGRLAVWGCCCYRCWPALALRARPRLCRSQIAPACLLCLPPVLAGGDCHPGGWRAGLAARPHFAAIRGSVWGEAGARGQASPCTPRAALLLPRLLPQTCCVACYGMAFNGGFGTYSERGQLTLAAQRHGPPIDPPCPRTDASGLRRPH